MTFSSPKQQLPLIRLSRALLALVCLLQFGGLEHLCLCGSCATSKVLLGDEPEHACCAKARHAPGWHAEGSCSCGDHLTRAVDADLRPPVQAPLPPTLALVAPGAQHVAVLLAAAAPTAPCARAPPVPLRPTWLLTRSLRI